MAGSRNGSWRRHALLRNYLDRLPESVPVSIRRQLGRIQLRAERQLHSNLRRHIG
jgi:hypothetical protein